VGLPLIVQQVASHLEGMKLTVQIALMAALTMRWTKYKYLILGWFGLECLLVMFEGIGSRTSLFALFGAFAMAYHFTVRRIRIRSAILLGVVGLVAFQAMGVMRGISIDDASADLNPFNYPSEFMRVFSNANDLLRAKQAGQTTRIAASVYIGDFSALIPQQLLPFSKTDPVDWYVQTFYPAFAAEGGGLVFGAVPESIVGLGHFDAIWRGAVLGIIFAVIFNKLRRKQCSFWQFVFYLWLTLFCFKCFRSTTFRLLPAFLYDFLTVYILARLMLFVAPEQLTVGLREFAPKA
jgi:hypothetical protein